MLIRDTETGDHRVEAGTVVESAPRLDRHPGEDVVDAAGGALLPGLHDHHIHLRALAAARVSVDVSGGLDALAQPPGDGWIRATGYHESVAGALDRWMLDRVTGRRPVRVQHRSGELWMLNSAAARAVGLPDDHDGRLWRRDRWLADRVPPVALDLAAAGRDALAAGVTTFTETTPHLSAADVEALAGAGLPQRLHVMVPAGVTDPGLPRVTLGPHKLLLDDATLPSVDELAAAVAAAPRGVAAHCVTRLQLVAFLAADPRPGDRVEHGAVIPPELVAELARRRLVVVTQPNFVAERGAQYRTDVEPDELPNLYRCRSLLDAGVSVLGGTDAPFGGADPWAAMRAAVGRTLGPGERVTPRQALALFTGASGACLLHVPLAVQLAELEAANVRAAWPG